jgi:hypothetical protein
MLRFDALLPARTSRSGLLRVHAVDAFAVCAALDCPRWFLVPCSAGRAASLYQVNGSNFLGSKCHICPSVPTSHPLSFSTTTQNLV